MDLQLTDADKARFWAKVDKSGDCWLWTAYKDKRGFGFMHLSGTPESVGRIAWAISKGAIPTGKVIDRACHNVSCVNPEHLRAVTHKQDQENRTGASTRNKSSGVRGVTWDKARNMWKAHVGHERKVINVGRFASIEEAERAVIAKRKELYTHNDADRG